MDKQQYALFQGGPWDAEWHLTSVPTPLAVDLTDVQVIPVQWRGAGHYKRKGPLPRFDWLSYPIW